MVLSLSTDFMTNRTGVLYSRKLHLEMGLCSISLVSPDIMFFTVLEKVIVQPQEKLLTRVWWGRRNLIRRNHHHSSERLLRPATWALHLDSKLGRFFQVVVWFSLHICSSVAL